MYYQKNGIKYKVIAELHGLFDPNSLGRSEDNTNTAHLNIRITSLETRYFKFYSTNKVKALLLFSSYFKYNTLSWLNYLIYLNQLLSSIKPWTWVER